MVYKNRPNYRRLCLDAPNRPYMPNGVYASLLLHTRGTKTLQNYVWQARGCEKQTATTQGEQNSAQSGDTPHRETNGLQF